MNYKLHALRLIRKYLTLVKAKLPGKAFIDSQFNYVLFIWIILCQKGLYVKIEKIHHKTLRIIHQSNTSYCDLHWQYTSILQRHLQFLLMEIYKSNVTTNRRFMWHFFREKKVPYILRKGAVLFLPPARSTTHGVNSAHFRGILIYNQLPSSIKPSKSIIEFNTNLK